MLASHAPATKSWKEDEESPTACTTAEQSTIPKLPMIPKLP
jgi:hypothetical protein